MFASLGATSATDAGAVGAAQFLLNLANLLVDREAVAAQLWELAEVMKQHLAVRADIERREQAVSHREREATQLAQALAKREADVGERERQLTHATARVEEQRAEIAALKADLRQAWAA
jgi:septal ring factor EnvC (AmiA/AmiB activator)